MEHCGLTGLASMDIRRPNLQGLCINLRLPQCSPEIFRLPRLCKVALWDSHLSIGRRVLRRRLVARPAQLQRPLVSRQRLALEQLARPVTGLPLDGAAVAADHEVHPAHCRYARHNGRHPLRFHAQLLGDGPRRSERRNLLQCGHSAHDRGVFCGRWCDGGHAHRPSVLDDRLDARCLVLVPCLCFEHFYRGPGRVLRPRAGADGHQLPGGEG
mmetsp:Transcript_68745/g.223847  ORF Transcript_68745/g.223847 Transcript_68745/m.223847 type:complete len:213 (-) Transcript_68745:1156-1794(-)